jgi:hypothetical protein
VKIPRDVVRERKERFEERVRRQDEEDSVKRRARNEARRLESASVDNAFIRVVEAENLDEDKRACSIYYGELQDPEVSGLPCDHVLHDGCIEMRYASKEKDICPYCRREFHLSRRPLGDDGPWLLGNMDVNWDLPSAGERWLRQGGPSYPWMVRGRGETA